MVTIVSYELQCIYYYSLLYDVGIQACFNFTFSFHLFKCLPQSWHPFGLYYTISCPTLSSFYPDGLPSFVCTNVLHFVVTVLSGLSKHFHHNMV